MKLLGGSTRCIHEHYDTIFAGRRYYWYGAGEGQQQQKDETQNRHAKRCGSIGARRHFLDNSRNTMDGSAY